MPLDVRRVDEAPIAFKPVPPLARVRALVRERLSAVSAPPTVTAPARDAVVVFGSNQYSDVVVELPPMATMSDDTFG